jgi:hypothetical protein
MSTGRTTRKSLIKKVNRSRSRTGATKKTSRSAAGRKRESEDVTQPIDPTQDNLTTGESRQMDGELNEQGQSVQDTEASVTSEGKNKQEVKDFQEAKADSGHRQPDSGPDEPLAQENSSQKSAQSNQTQAKDGDVKDSSGSSSSDNQKQNANEAGDKESTPAQDASGSSAASSDASRSQSRQQNSRSNNDDRSGNRGSRHNNDRRNSSRQDQRKDHQVNTGNYSVVPPDKFMTGFKKARHQINHLIDDIVGSMKSKIFITELELSLSFNANGDFLGFGEDGDAVIRIKVDPSVA